LDSGCDPAKGLAEYPSSDAGSYLLFPRRAKAEPATPILVISLILLSVGTLYRRKRNDV
jgi:hypothetical protein